MVRTGNQSEIIKGIVKFVPINMVDNLVSTQGPPKFHGHDMTMFQDSFPVYRDKPITMRIYSPFTICPLFAEMRIAIADKSQIVAIAKPMPLDRGLVANGAGIWGKMFFKSASFRVADSAVHLPSFSSNILRTQTEVKRDGGKNGVNSGEALTDGAEGNPEPSRGYTPGRCNDYRRGLAPLITGQSAPLERDEIVYSLWKHEVLRHTTDCDGVGMEKPLARGASGVGSAGIAGVCAESIAASAYGLIQVWGYHSAVRVKSSTTATGAVAKGTALAACVTAYYALANVPDTGTYANAYCKGIALAAQALYTTTATACFIMCL